MAMHCSRIYRQIYVYYYPLERESFVKNFTSRWFLLITIAYIAFVIASCGKPQMGPAGPRGADGVGTQGEQGDQGPQGNPGANGADGQDATPVTVVNLCPGYSSYPGVLVEIGLCIGGQLYGVYSSPVFLTLLPPGNYNSIGIGSACNLTVTANCTVTH